MGFIPCPQVKRSFNEIRATMEEGSIQAVLLVMVGIF
jgi:hypothetical protein